MFSDKEAKIRKGVLEFILKYEDSLTRLSIQKYCPDTRQVACIEMDASVANSMRVHEECRCREM